MMPLRVARNIVCACQATGIRRLRQRRQPHRHHAERIPLSRRTVRPEPVPLLSARATTTSSQVPTGPSRLDPTWFFRFNSSERRGQIPGKGMQSQPASADVFFSSFGAQRRERIQAQSNFQRSSEQNSCRCHSKWNFKKNCSYRCIFFLLWRNLSC
jgi:hypothetical protein